MIGLFSQSCGGIEMFIFLSSIGSSTVSRNIFLIVGVGITNTLSVSLCAAYEIKHQWLLFGWIRYTFIYFFHFCLLSISLSVILFWNMLTNSEILKMLIKWSSAGNKSIILWNFVFRLRKFGLFLEQLSVILICLKKSSAIIS